MKRILAPVRNLGVDGLSRALPAAALHRRELGLKIAVEPRLLQVRGVVGRYDGCKTEVDADYFGAGSALGWFRG